MSGNMSEQATLESQSLETNNSAKHESELRHDGELAEVGDIEAQREKLSEKEDDSVPATEEDPFLVKWKGDEDPENPLNFSTKRKASLMVMVAAIAFLTYPSVFRFAIDV
jgi:hypothetical protein